MKTLAEKLSGRRRTLGTVCGLLVCALIIVWLVPFEHREEPVDLDAISPAPVKSDPLEEASAPRPRYERQQEPTARRDVFPQFYPERVLGNPECQVRASGDTAVVLLPHSGGTRFVAVDTTGVLHSGKLSYWPEWAKVAKRPDGSVLTAFGDSIRAGADMPGPDARFPVSIHSNGEPMFELEDVWWFGLAGDGSSYYLIEPQAGDTSRLLIRNLDEGTERSYDIGDMTTAPPASHFPYRIRYSLDYSELNFSPGIDGVGTHYFYPVGGERHERREIRVPEGGEEGTLWAQSAVFESSEVGYVTFSLPGRRFLLTRRERNWSSRTNEAAQSWAHVMEDPDASPENMSISPNGDLLLLDGWTIRLLDSATGAPVFAMPVVDEDAQLARLASVLGPDATVEQIGSNNAVNIIGEHLYIGRQFSLKLNGFEGNALDVYELEGIHLDSSPTRRIAYSPEAPPCSPDRKFQGLRERDGHLIYSNEPVETDSAPS